MSRSKPAVRPIFVILLAMLSEPASAELRVVAAEGVDIEVGAEFPDDHVFDLLDNGKLGIGLLVDHTVWGMFGPYKGTFADYLAECRAEKKLSSSAEKKLSKHCGGADR